MLHLHFRPKGTTVKVEKINSIAQFGSRGRIAHSASHLLDGQNHLKKTHQFYFVWLEVHR
jgi:hypothetical protein